MNTKVGIKNQDITAFGGIFQAEDLFNRLFSKLTDTFPDLRSPSGIGYQFSEVFRNVNSIYLCGGDHIEDITTYFLGGDLKLHPNARVASSDTVSRALKAQRRANTALACAIKNYSRVVEISTADLRLKISYTLKLRYCAVACCSAQRSM